MSARTRPATKTTFAPSPAALSAKDQFALAVDHHLAGRTSEAESRYRSVIARDPGFAEAHNNLGVLLRSVNATTAHTCFERAVAGRSDYLEGLLNLGMSWSERGALDDAIACFRAALKVSPDNGKALNELGAALRVRGELAEALVVMRRAVAALPEDAATHINLANVLLQQGLLADARASYETSLALRPDYPEALNNLGTAYRGLREYEKALPLFLRALDLKPGYLDAMHNLALGLPSGLPGAESIEKRLREEVGRLPLAPEPLAVLAVYLQEAGRFDEARTHARTVLDRDPSNVDAWTVLGICEAEAGNPRKAIECYDRARAVNPRFAVARWNRAIALLALGEYGEGWREYESRWELVHMALDKRQFGTDEWDGTSLDGRTILIYTEQGLGDAIQFARFARELKCRWRTRIVIECDATLVTLFRSCEWVDGVVARGSVRPEFDAHVALLSLPRILGATIDSLPTAPAFPVIERPVAMRVRKSDGVLDVGIVWGGRAPNPALARRSLPLDLLAPLAGVPGIRLHSLQVGEASGQLEHCAFREVVNDLSPHISDFVDTASVMAKLDLVVTIDTSVAHLAGSLGVPTWVMLIKNADWRWLLERNDSPWYPGARLFRQREPGRWESVVEEITSALTELAASDARALRPVHMERSSAAPMTEVAAQQRLADGVPRFTISVPLSSLGDQRAFQQYSCELAGPGVDAEARFFLDAKVCEEDVVLDFDSGWGFTALGAATAPTPPALVIAVVGDTDAAAAIASGARTAPHIGPVRVHVRGDTGDAGIDRLIARYAPDAKRLFVRAHGAGVVLSILATGAEALTRGAVATLIWTRAEGAGDTVGWPDQLALDGLASLGFEHFELSTDGAQPVLSPLPSKPASRTVFSVLTASANGRSTAVHGGGHSPTGSVVQTARVLGIDWQVGAASGWGVYGLNLVRRAIASDAALPAPLLPLSLAAGTAAETLDAVAPAMSAHVAFAEAVAANGDRPLRVPFLMLRALGNGLHVAPHGAGIVARRNVGVVFLESTDLDAAAMARGRRFDRLVAGSAWNAELLESRGLPNVTTVLQGIDPAIFHPRPRRSRRRDRFVIFSGGKLEYRKGQDIAAVVFREFQRRHPEALLMLAWHNHWPHTMREIGTAGHVTGVPAVDAAGRQNMTGWLADNGVPSHSVIDLGLRANADMAALVAEADVALFTNRAEGGTNLVAMECLALGVPTILSANTGHLDLIDDARCYALRAQRPARSTASFGGVDGWGESQIDEALTVLEHVYSQPEEAALRATTAAEWMRTLAWDRQIDRLLASIEDLL